jgi:hypothetical protein
LLHYHCQIQWGAFSIFEVVCSNSHWTHVKNNMFEMSQCRSHSVIVVPLIAIKEHRVGR